MLTIEQEKAALTKQEEKIYYERTDETLQSLITISVKPKNVQDLDIFSQTELLDYKASRDEVDWEFSKVSAQVIEIKIDFDDPKSMSRDFDEEIVV